MSSAHLESARVMTDQTSEAEKLLQQKKYAEIVESLIAAGYYRAQITTLGEFDKVVGGLCWCITVSGEDVDVDILFQENSTIGQRIALTEAIVTALRKMGCPNPLQAHQIQGGVGGSDFAAIYPVILWLIKKGREWKAEHQEQLRAFSIMQFSKNYQLPTECLDASEMKQLASIIDSQKAVRQYRRKASPKETEEKRVLACLLEFGESFVAGAAGGGETNKIVLNITEGDISLDGLSKLGGGAGGGDLGAFERKLAQAAKDAMKEEQLMAERAALQQVELMEQMRQVSSEEGLSASQVGAFVSMSAGEIGNASAAYQAQLEVMKKLMDSNLSGGKVRQAAAYKRQKELLLKHRDEVDAKLAELRVLTGSVLAQLEVVEEDQSSTTEYNDQLKRQVVKLNDLEGLLVNTDDVAMLKHLVSLNESLVAQEAAFKTTCKGQLAELQAKLDALTRSDSEQNEENKKLREIEETHAAATAKYAKLRQVLAESNRMLANSNRVIDDVPSRIELIQYERRFAELYQQVGGV